MPKFSDSPIDSVAHKKTVELVLKKYTKKLNIGDAEINYVSNERSTIIPAVITDELFKDVFLNNLPLATASHDEESFSLYCFEHLVLHFINNHTIKIQEVCLYMSI